MRAIRRDAAGGGEIAMMAVITKAMGAFLVIMILLLPHYTTDPVAQRTADETTEQIDEVKEELRDAQEKLGKGRLTDEEIDELLKRIETALQQLEQALAKVRQLQARVKSLSVRVNQLEQEVLAQRREIEAQYQQIAALREEIERLKEELERLKRNQRPQQYYWNSVRLDWSRCAGAWLNLYGASDQPDEAGKLNPPPDRTLQGVFFSHDLSLSEVIETTTDAVRSRPVAGSYTWVLDRLRPNETVTFYVKYLNALPDGPNECELTARWRNLPSGDAKLNDTIKAKITEKEPYIVLVRLKAEGRGSFTPQAVSDQERQEFRTRIAASPCEGTTCGRTDPNSHRAFAGAIVDRFIGELIPNKRVAEAGDAATEKRKAEAVLTALGSSYAAGKMNYADVKKWVGLLADPAKYASGDAFDEQARELYAERMRSAELPDVVVDMFRSRARAGLYTASAVRGAFFNAGLGHINLKPSAMVDAHNAKDMLEQAIKDGIDPAVARAASALVAEGRCVVGACRALLKLIHEHRDGPALDQWRSRAGQELQRLLERNVGTVNPYAPLLRALNPHNSRVPAELALDPVRQIEAAVQ